MNQTSRWRLKAPYAAGGVSLVSDDGDVVGVRPVDTLAGMRHEVQFFPRGAGIRFDDALEPGSVLDLELDVVQTESAPPRGRCVRWVQALPEARLLKQSEKPRWEVLAIPQGRAGFAIADAVRAESRIYFSLLDRRSNPRLGQMDMRLMPQVNAVWATLRERLTQRCTRNRASQSAPGALPLHQDPVHVQAVSQLILSVLVEVFGEPLRDPDRLTRIGAAHDVFSWGGVYVRSTEPAVERPNMSPDGAAIFMFPEFAHLALAMGIDEEDWTALLPILTRMPALYLRVHELADPSFKARPFGEYGHPPDCALYESDLADYAAQLEAGHMSRSTQSLADCQDDLLFLAVTPEVA